MAYNPPTAGQSTLYDSNFNAVPAPQQAYDANFNAITGPAMQAQASAGVAEPSPEPTTADPFGNPMQTSAVPTPQGMPAPIPFSQTPQAGLDLSATANPQQMYASAPMPSTDFSNSANPYPSDFSKQVQLQGDQYQAAPTPTGMGMGMAQQQPTPMMPAPTPMMPGGEAQPLVQPASINYAMPTTTMNTAFPVAYPNTQIVGVPIQAQPAYTDYGATTTYGNGYGEDFNSNDYGSGDEGCCTFENVCKIIGYILAIIVFIILCVIG